MHTWVYLYLCVVYVCVSVCWIYMYANVVCVSICICVYCVFCMYVSVCICMFCVCLCMYVHLCVCVCICVLCVWVFVCVFTCRCQGSWFFPCGFLLNTWSHLFSPTYTKTRGFIGTFWTMFLRCFHHIYFPWLSPIYSHYSNRTSLPFSNKSSFLLQATS